MLSPDYPAGPVRALCQQMGTRDVLHYGCGDRNLEKNLGFPITNYDPRMEGLTDSPWPAKIVVVMDYLEHIQIHKLDILMNDLKELVLNVGLFVISRTPKENDPDDRRRFLLKEGKDWWMQFIGPRFTVRGINDTGEEAIFLVESSGRNNDPRILSFLPIPN